jgi:acyl carrier protein
VAESLGSVVSGSISSWVIYPQDRIVADLGVGAGPDMQDTALIVALENDLGISIPDPEAETVDTVEDLVHLWERCLSISASPPT